MEQQCLCPQIPTWENASHTWGLLAPPAELLNPGTHTYQLVGHQLRPDLIRAIDRFHVADISCIEKGGEEVFCYVMGAL